MTADVETLGLMVGLFGLTYVGIISIHIRIGKISGIIKVLCREHKKNHGGDAIECD